MACLVMKFGGTSVADIDRIRIVARHVAREVNAGHQVVVVVSAMAGTTNRLVGWVQEISGSFLPDKREYDTVVASGEQIVSGLLAIAIRNLGISARSWQGWQIPILTNEHHGSALVEKIDPAALCEALSSGEVAVISGFQGLTPLGRISTLGRGGSDTSAVAVAAVIGANRCDIYTDVNGVYTADPRLVSNAQRLGRIAYGEMLEMAQLGAKVLHARAVEMAMYHHVPLLVRSSFFAPEELAPAFTREDTGFGTFVCGEDQIMEWRNVSGIAHSCNEVKLALVGVKSEPDMFVRILGSLAEARINVDMIVQSVSTQGRTNMTFTVQRPDFKQAVQIIESLQDILDYEELISANNVGKLSVIGVGMQSHSGVALRMFKVLADLGIVVHVVSTSEIKISVLIDEVFIERAVQALHAAYDLDKV